MFAQTTSDTKRILGRELGRELDRTELDLIGGGDDHASMAAAGTDTVPHAGTCSNEQDCD
jgi:hypothetical protein